MIKLQFLGTGGAFTDYRDNYHNNALIYLKNKYVMIDCGSTAPQALKELGISVHDIECVVVTHLHGDHIGGIEQLAWERFYTGKSGPAFAKTKIVTTSDIVDDLISAITPCVNEITTLNGTHKGGFDCLFDVVVVTNDIYNIEDLTIEFVKTKHVVGPETDKPSYGLFVYNERDSFYYTSDTIFNYDIYKKFNCVIFHDCTFMPKYQNTVHTHYEELQTISYLEKTRTILMHYTKLPINFNLKESGFRAAKRYEIFIVNTTLAASFND